MTGDPFGSDNVTSLSDRTSVFRRFGPDDWGTLFDELTNGRIDYVRTPQTCPYCQPQVAILDESLTVTLAKGARPPRFNCSKCSRNGDVLALIAGAHATRLVTVANPLAWLAKWADSHDLPETYIPPRKPVRADLLSARRLLQRDPDLNGLVSYDLFRNEIVLERAIPRPDYGLPELWTPRKLADEDVTALTEVMLDRELLKASSSMAFEVLRGIAHDIEKHPVRDWLNSLEWDSDERLTTWLKDFASAVTEDPEKRENDDRLRYIEAVSRASLIGAVARVMRPGCKHDHVLTLIGPQGKLKSRLLATLPPFTEWFSDSLTHDMADKDAVIGLAGVWICEMAELAALNKTDFNLAKAFLSRQVDKFRPPFARLDIRLPRQVAFFATTNFGEPFKDETGNRRYWPLDCGRVENGKEIPIDPDGLAAIRDQLWAEAVHCYKAGEKWWLTPELETIARGEQDKRCAEHALAARIEETVVGLETPFQIDDILKKWEVRDSDYARVAVEVGKALRSLHYAQRRQRTLSGVNPRRLWWPPG